jgi:hypothetical protein
MDKSPPPSRSTENERHSGPENATAIGGPHLLIGHTRQSLKTQTQPLRMLCHFSFREKRT